MDEPLTPTRLRERRQTPGLSPATLGVNSNMSNTTDRASRKKLPFVTSSTTSVNVASAMNRHLRSELGEPFATYASEQTTQAV